MFPVYLSQQLEDQSANGTGGAQDGRCWFVAPFAGKALRVFISNAAAPGALQTYTLRSARGVLTIGTIPTSVALGDTVVFDLDQFDPKNQIETGGAFAIESDGAGAVASKGGVTVEFSPK